MATGAISMSEYFAGIGLVREALRPLGIEVRWANDIEPGKLALYAANHDAAHFHLGDVRQVRGSQVPFTELATSSFPCTDVSLAGDRRGLSGTQSGMFWQFARILNEKPANERPSFIMCENVAGLATSRGGQDLADAIGGLNRLGYSIDVLAIDARHFVPQSRVRMFIVGALGELPKGASLGVPPLSDVRPAWIRDLHERHAGLRMHFVDLPDLPEARPELSSKVERLAPRDERWWDSARLGAFLDSLSSRQAERLELLRPLPTQTWRSAYRRTRLGVARWEIRNDALAGCLRTTGGGSSKQAIVQVGRGGVQVRWMTPREYARLMGAEHYKLGATTDNQTRFGFGDAVVVDVIRWLGRHYLIPALRPDGEPGP